MSVKSEYKIVHSGDFKHFKKRALQMIEHAFRSICYDSNNSANSTGESSEEYFNKKAVSLKENYIGTRAQKYVEARWRIRANMYSCQESPSIDIGVCTWVGYHKADLTMPLGIGSITRPPMLPVFPVVVSCMIDWKLRCNERFNERKPCIRGALKGTILSSLSLSCMHFTRLPFIFFSFVLSISIFLLIFNFSKIYKIRSGL